MTHHTIDQLHQTWMSFFPVIEVKKRYINTEMCYINIFDLTFSNKNVLLNSVIVLSLK